MSVLKTEIGPIAAILTVYDKQQVAFSIPLPRQIVIGRQDLGDPEPFRIVNKGNVKHLIVARSDENSVSRRHVQLTVRPDNRIRVANCSTVCPVDFDSRESLNCGESCELALPMLFYLGERAVRVESDVDEELPLDVLAHPTMLPGQSLDPESTRIGLVDVDEENLDSKRLLHWLRVTANVFQTVASSPNFMEEAVRAACAMIRLDFTAALLVNDDHWEVVAEYSTQAKLVQWRPSQTVLNRLREECRTVRHDPSMFSDHSQTPASMEDIRSLVAAPIMDRQGQVIGAMYGGRGAGSNQSTGIEIREAEAAYFELLAGGIAAGLARVQQEKAAMAARVRFEQFFTPELAKELEANPDLLLGREADVSILFCDIRGFSRVSNRIGPQRTMEWINDVMGTLSECVAEHDGVLVDYIGDGLMAMWGAPTESPDHPLLACRAAFAMIDKLAGIDLRWETELGSSTTVGIGINSGMSYVGNTGSHLKFKYGPLGNTVNLASRVQNATKHLKTTLLVTEETASQLNEELYNRALGPVQVIDIEEPVELYEMVRDPSEGWPGMARDYETALKHFRESNFREASRLLSNNLANFPNDGPSLCLLARTVNAMASKPEPSHPVWILPSK